MIAKQDGVRQNGEKFRIPLMSLIPIPCPHCAQVTRVDMERSLTSQACDKCGQFIYSADIGQKPDTELRKHRRKRWHSLSSTVMSELEAEDVDSTDAFRRKRLQVWHVPMFMVMVILAVAVIFYLIRRARIERGLDKDPDLVVQTSLQHQGSTLNKGAILSLAENASEIAPDEKWAEDAHELATNFLAAESSEELIPLVRNPQLVGPNLTAFAKGAGNLPIAKYAEIIILYVVDQAQPLGELAMLFFNDQHGRLKNVFIVKTAEGLKVDWQSYSGESEMGLQEFLEQRPTEPVLLRVMAHRDDYYNYDFQERNLITCLRLVNWEETITFYGYISLHGPSESFLRLIPPYLHELEYVVRPKPRPISVKARFLLGSQSPNQVEITEIVGQGWYVP